MNQKGFASIVLVMVIVAVIAIGVYFIFSKKSVTPTNTSTSNQAANNEMATKPSISPSQKTIDSNKEVEFTFSTPKGAVQSKIYLSCESGLYAYFSDNITPRTPTPYPNICNTWQENTWDTVQPDSTLLRDVRDIKFRNDTMQGKVATLQMTVTMPNSLVLKSDLSSITINLTPTSSSGTVDWKTYTNSQYGFEIKYPSSKTVMGDFDKNHSIGISSPAGTDTFLIRFSTKTLEQAKNDIINQGYSVVSDQNIVFNGYNATKLVYRANGPDGSDPYNTILISHGGGTFEITYALQDYTTMLSTFKFTK